jgi:hypothetical protein
MGTACWLFAFITLLPGMPVRALQTPPAATLPDGIVEIEKALAEKDFDRALRISQAALHTAPTDTRL